jgi:hypothetical protein
LTKAVGIEPCDACERRRAWLNEFGDKMAKLLKPREEAPREVSVEE